MAYGPQLDRLAARWAEQPRSTAFAPLADALRKAGALDDAFTIAKTGVSARPDYLPGHLVLAGVHASRQEWWAAEQVLRAGLTLDPDHPVILAELARLEQRDQPPDAPVPAAVDIAVDATVAAMAGNEADADLPPATPTPSADEPWDSIGDADADHGEFDDDSEAEPEFDAAAIADEPMLTESLAMLYRGQGHFDRALEVYEALVERHPDNASLVSRRDAVRIELEATQPKPFPASATGGTSVRAWLASVAVAPSPESGARSGFDAFYETALTAPVEPGDMAAFQAWLRELDR